MNVAIVLDTLVGGGAERVAQRLATSLAHCGHRSLIYCLKSAGTEPAALIAQGVVVREAHSIGRDWRLPHRLSHWMRRDRIDVVQAHTCSAYLCALPAAKRLRRPIVHVRHGNLLGTPSKYRRWADRLVSLADRVVVVAQSERAVLPAGRVRREALYIPDGLDLDPLPRHASRRLLERLVERKLKGPVVLNIGTICEEKDPITLIRAFDALRRRHTGATLIWIGPEREPGSADAVRRVVNRLNLSEHALFPGPAEDAWRFIAGADVFCLSSVSEALPNVVIEAMSQRTPIVATTVGDVGTLDHGDHRSHWLLRNRETGLLAPPRDATALAQALDAMIADRAASASRAERALQVYRSRYTVEHMTARYLRAYRTCVRHSARAARFTPERGRAAPSAAGVLMSGPGAPLIGGIVSVIDALMRGPLSKRYRLERWVGTTAQSNRAAGVWRGLRERGRAVVRHLAHVRDFRNRIRRSRIRIVHIHTASFESFYRSAIDLFAARRLGCRVYLHIHGAKFDAFCAEARFIGRRIIRAVCEAADTLIVLSEAWRGRLRPYVGDARIDVVPNGVAVLAAPRARRPVRATCRFAFLGALVERKGLPELFLAMKRLRSEGPACELHLAGPAAPADRARWQARVRAADLGDCVRFVGPVRDSAKEQFLAQADCLVLPSRNEGLPIVLLEAAVRELPLITTSVGSIPELLCPRPDAPPLAPLIAPGDVDALVAAMRTIATDPALREQIGKRLRERVVGRFSLDAQSDAIGRIYERDRGRAHAVRRRSVCRLDEPLVRHLSYPLHESLRGRRTISTYHSLRRLAQRDRSRVAADHAARVRSLLRFAGRHLPYYRDRFRKCRVDPEGTDPLAELRKLPPLTKTEIRANAPAMTFADASGGLVPYSSGGTTGDTLDFFIDRAQQGQGLGARLYMQSLFGVLPGDRRAYVWGAPIDTRRGRLKRLRDRLLNEIVLDAFEMSDRQIDAHLDRLLAFRPRCIYGYPSAIALLARRAALRCSPTDFPWLRLIVLTGEEITAEQRAESQTAFGCPVAGEYGSRETGLMAHECPHGSLHIVSPNVHIDIGRGTEAVGADQLGDLIVTTLNTRAQPFIRYRIGDVGALASASCGCGLPFPLMRVEAGKVTGFVALPNGRLCHGAITSHVLRDQPGIVEFKTIQHALDRFEVFLVTDGAFQHAQTVGLVRERYQRLVGGHVQVDIRIVDRIPSDPSGKRRYVVSHVAPETSRFDADPLDAATIAPQLVEA